MSGSQSSQGSAKATGTAAGTDPSMEDILASIRRILSEDEAPDAAKNPQSAASKPTVETADGVLVLDPAMIVAEPSPAFKETPMAEPPTQPVVADEPRPANVPMSPVPALVAPEAAAAAASSVGSLVRTLAAERYTQVRSGGPTIEDLVREEIRPLLKEWLDTNLPPLVERLVRAEIERVVGRAVP
jgi:uncharacterized protein